MRKAALAAVAAMTMCGAAWGEPCGVMLDSNPPQATPPCLSFVGPAEMPAVSPGPSRDDLGRAPMPNGTAVSSAITDLNGVRRLVYKLGANSWNWHAIQECASSVALDGPKRLDDQAWCSDMLAARLDGWRAAGREGEPGEGGK